MIAAAWPREDRVEERLLRVDRASGTLHDARVRDLPAMLQPGDLLVVNDSATLPVSLHGTGPRGAPVEVRLIAPAKNGRWSAVLFGAGDWRTRTEDRPPPPALRAGDGIRFGTALAAVVTGVSAQSPRLVDVELDRTGAAMWSAIYALGKPVQYAHVERPLALWHVQNGYASRPWSAEMPSAGRPLTFATLVDLRRRGVEVASLTHAAGLSSTGDAALDAALPLTERYDIPEATAQAVDRTRARGGRVVATGTSVVRALEGCAKGNVGELGGRVVAGEGETSLILGEASELRVVGGLLTGIHEPSETHFGLLRAFLPAALLERAHEHAEQARYLCHEFGDSMLVL
jgi:S-adenosylmethionine:tRNA ribosyltransferase-isomerase